MGKVRNIGLLDAREATEDSLKGITELENIGMLLLNDRSVSLIHAIKKVNIGEVIKLPMDIDLTIMNGEFIIDNSLLEGIEKKLFIIMNGKCIIKEVSKDLFNDKIYSIIVNGKVICPDYLKGSVQIKGKVNGVVMAHKEGYRFMDKTWIVKENSIIRYTEGTKLSVSKLVAVEPLDRQMLQEHLDRIQVLDHIIISKENIQVLSEIVDDFDDVDMTIVPEESLYIEKSIELNKESVNSYTGKTLVVDGSVSITDLSKEELDSIQGIHCDIVYCNKEIYEGVKNVIINDAEIQVSSDNTISNRGKLIITNAYLSGLSGQHIIENRGKLLFDESVSPDMVKEKIKRIDNRGKIMAKAEVLSGVTISNRGSIMASDEEEEKVVEEDIIYENMGTLVL